MLAGIPRKELFSQVLGCPEKMTKTGDGLAAGMETTSSLPV